MVKTGVVEDDVDMRADWIGSHMISCGWNKMQHDFDTHCFITVQLIQSDLYKLLYFRLVFSGTRLAHAKQNQLHS